MSMFFVDLNADISVIVSTFLSILYTWWNSKKVQNIDIF